MRRWLRSYTLRAESGAGGQIFHYSIIDLRSDVLKVGHHAACDSSSKEFLDRVSPEVAVISVAESNRFGYPCPDTLQRLKESVERVYRTDRDGSIVVEFDGGNMKIRNGHKGAEGSRLKK